MMDNDSASDQRRPSNQIVLRLFLAAVTYIIGFFPISWLAMRVTPQDQLGIIRYAYRPVLELLIVLPDKLAENAVRVLEFGAPQNLQPAIARSPVGSGNFVLGLIWVELGPKHEVIEPINSHTTWLITKPGPP